MRALVRLAAAALIVGSLMIAPNPWAPDYYRFGMAERHIAGVDPAAPRSQAYAGNFAAGVHSRPRK